MTFHSQHGIILCSISDTLPEVLENNGHNITVVPDALSVLPILVANPHTDLLIIDSDVPNSHILLQTLSWLVSPPPRIVIREKLSQAPHVEKSSVILLEPTVSDMTVSKAIEDSMGSTGEKGEKIHKILVIDDVADLIDMYEMMFSMKWYEVQTAKNGLEGIAKAGTFQPDLILLDIMMPSMDGYEMMKIFRENTSLKSVIAVNSNIEGVDVAQKIYSAGADYYLRKSDFTPSQMVYMIEQWLFNKKRQKTASLPTEHFHPGTSFFPEN